MPPPGFEPEASGTKDQSASQLAIKPCKDAGDIFPCQILNQVSLIQHFGIRVYHLHTTTTSGGCFRFFPYKNSYQTPAVLKLGGPPSTHTAPVNIPQDETDNFWKLLFHISHLEPAWRLIDS
ncbi:hypothetical protein CDAR_215901 [Caerostris darwini]|uniref:Uncharacterized protein n=1 Tax=Caerostris darwini TaxID=1538125 RepID=A0AAV4NMV0_9ARAC|nr:hypothetical protein CDAR_215901 [Caerostris darwini]